MANIRMPDGTVIRGVPDGVGKDELNSHLIEKYGQEKFDTMTGATKAALSTGDDILQANTPYGKDVIDTAAAPTRYPMKPSIEEISDSPERAAHVAKKGTLKEQADRKRQAAAASEEFPDRLSPEQVYEQVVAASKDAEYNRQYAQFAGDDEMPMSARLDQSPREAARRKFQEFVDSGQYTAEELKMTQSEFDFIATPMEPPTTPEEVKKDTDKRLYYANLIHTPDVAEEMFPEIHKEEQEKAWQPAAKTDPSLKGKDKNGWMAFWGTAIVEGGQNVVEGYKMSAAAARRTGAESQMIGQLVLNRAAEEYENLAPEAKRIVDDAAKARDMSPEEMSAKSFADFVKGTLAESESMQNTLDNISLIEASKPISADTTLIGHYGDLLIQNSTQAAYIVTGMMLRSPMFVAGAMGTEIYGKEYGARRLQGRTHEQAHMDALSAVVIEGVTEAVPVANALRLLKQGKRGKFRRMMEIGATEFTQEILAEAAMIGYDMGVIGEDVTWGEAWNRLTDAGVVGVAMGTVMTAPSVATMDVDLADAQEKIDSAKKALGDVAKGIQGKAGLSDLKAMSGAKKDYVDAVKAKRKIQVARKKEEAEKKKVKAEKKETKRKGKLTEVESRQEDAQAAAAKADQSVKGALTDEDLKMADSLEKAANAELEEEDATAVQEMLEAGYLRVTSAGTAVLLPAGKKRLEAVRAAQEGAAPQEDEVIEPVPYERPETRAAREAVDEEIGRRIRGETAIKPTPYTSVAKRRAEIDRRVDEKVKEPEARNKIVDAILKSEEMEQDFDARESEKARASVQRRDDDYTKALEEQVEVELGLASNLAELDEASVSGYVGTRLGDVLRNAMGVMEREEAKAIKELESAFWNKPTQGTLFDVGGALAKGTKDYANLVKVGVLKLAKHGLKYSAWTADMIGQFGDSIRPVMSRVWHDAKKRANDVMKLSHEKFLTGKRKGELKYAPKQYAKPGQIRRMRMLLEKLATEGEGGRFWYEKSGQEILKITGGNMKSARKLAGLFAIYSQGTAVSANTTNALKMWAQFVGTDGKIKMPRQGTLAGRFGRQDKLAIEWMKSKETDEHFAEKFGNKVFPFFQNIMREIDPKNYEAGQGVTVDLWMMRALGYDKSAPTDAQFAFVATEIKSLADKLGWEKQQVQAAVWVAIKARWEYVQKTAKAKAVAKGLAVISVGPKGKPIFEVIGSTREEQIENEKKIVLLFRGEALKASVGEIEKKLNESKADFADMLEKHYATISWEAEPSTKLGTKLNRLSLEDKILMQAEMAELFVNPDTGREFLAEWLGLMGADQMVGPGAWEMNLGSVVQNSVIVPVKHKPGKIKMSQKEAAAAMDGYAAIMGFLLQQDAVAWHKPFYASTKQDANGVEVILSSTLSYAKTLRFYEAIVEITGNEDFAPIVLDKAVRVLNFSEMDNKQFHKAIQSAAENAGLKGEIELFQSDGNLVGNDWRENTRGQEYVEAINESENPLVKKAFARAKRKFSGRVEAIHAKYAGEKAASARVTRVTSDTKLKRVPKGHLRFRHFGKFATGVLDVEKWGTGIKGEERRQGSLKVISAYPNRGFKKEAGLGPHEYVIDVPRSAMYDVNADPMGLKERAMDVGGSFTVNEDGTKNYTNEVLNMVKLEQLIKDAGFAGFYTPKAKGNLKGQARFFHSLVVDDSAAKGQPALIEDVAFSISDRPRVTVVENDLQEYEVREKDGEIYYTDDPDDAVGTARSIYGAMATVVIVNEDGDVITTDVVQTRPERIKISPADRLDPDASASISEFLDEWIEGTESNPISPDERLVDQKAAVSLRPFGGVIWLDSIRSFDKGTGGGSQALKFVLELADLHGVTLKLTAKPFDTGGSELDFKSLVHWYQRNGFITERTDEGYEPSSVMQREPRNPDVDVAFSAWKRPAIKTNEGYGIPRARAQAFVEKYFGRWFDLANYKVVDSIEDLPDDLYGQLSFFGLGDRVRGVYHDDAIDGPTIYVVANNLYVNDVKSKRFGEPDVDGLLEVVLHETVGHFGLRAMLGEDYNNVMDVIRRDFVSEVNRYGKELSKNPNGRRLAAEEFVAYTAQELLNGRQLKKNQISMLDRVINAIRIALSKMGIVTLNHNDIANLVMRSAMYVKNVNEAQLAKRARIVTRMREAQRLIDKAADVDVAMSIGLEKARKADPALDRFMAKIGHGKHKQLTRLRDWWDTRKRNIIKSLEIEILDSFAGIKHMEKELDVSGGYVSVRLTAGTDVIIRSAIERGVPIWSPDGSVMTDNTTEGLLEVLAPIAQNAEMLKAFEAFLVARRARRLKKENRERLFEREEIAAALKFIRKKKLYKLFNETAKQLADYKSKVLDFAQASGIIDPVSRKVWENADHVPFYRVLSDKNTNHTFSGGKIGRVGKVIHRLKGGTDVLKNPMESIVENLSMLIEASIKNKAMQDVIEQFNGTGVVTKAPQAEITTALVPMKQVKDMLHDAGVGLDAVGQEMLEGIQKLTALQAPTADNIVSVQEDGTRQYYYIHDPGVMRGMDNVSPSQWTWLMKILRLPKRVITRSITLMPDFILKNWFRDIWHAFVLSRHGTVLPVVESAKGWAQAIMQDETFHDVMSGGGMFDAGYVNASDPKKTNLAIRRALLGKGRHGFLDTPRKLAKFYMRIANGAENAHRIVVYEKTLKRTGSRKQALFEARDLMDFSVRGANPIIRFLTETVPFWGARVQGIARTGKGFTETPYTTLMRALPIVLASVALYMVNRDDDRYNGLNSYEKRMYYHFYDVFEKGDHFRLPKPFEVGAIFSTTPEIIAELMLSTESDRGKAAAEAFSWTVREMLMLAPHVQTVMPVYELMVNADSFTETPIITEWEKRLDPKDQYSYRSSATVREIAQVMPESAPDWAKSPKQLEHLLRGYFASMMDYALAASDMVFQKELNGGVMPPTARWDETPFAKSFVREEYGKYDLYLDSMYNVLEVADKIHNSINKNKKLPQTPEVKDRIAQLRADNEALLYARGPTSKASKTVSKINKHIRKVYAHPSWTPDVKREKVDALLRQRSEAAKKVYDYRPGGKLNKFEGGNPEDSYYDQITDFLKGLKGKPKEKQVDELISARLPHTATLINDVTISDEKLRRIA